MGWVPRPFRATRGEIQTFWFSGFGQSLNPEKTPRSQLSASWGPKPTHIPPNPDPNPAFCSGHPSFPHFRPSRPLFPPPPSRSPEIWPLPSVPPPTIKGPPSRKGSHGARCGAARSANYTGCMQCEICPGEAATQAPSAQRRLRRNKSAAIAASSPKGE